MSDPMSVVIKEMKIMTKTIHLYQLLCLIKPKLKYQTIVKAERSQTKV